MIGRTNANSVEPPTNAAGKTSTAPYELWGELALIAARYQAKLHWNSDSNGQWRVIVALSTEDQVQQFLVTDDLAHMARDMTLEIERFCASPRCTLFVEVDSEERVNSAEGWFFRIKSDPAPGREFIFSTKDLLSC